MKKEIVKKRQRTKRYEIKKYSKKEKVKEKYFKLCFKTILFFISKNIFFTI